MNSKEIRIVALLILDTVFFLLEAIIGYTVHSLALIADSFHMLNDIISLIIALWAVRVKNTKPADGKYTYGWQRAEILGALINAVFLLALCFTIIMDSIQRFFEPQEISNPKLILIVGIAGLVSNGVGLVLFHEHGHSHSHGGGGGGGEGDV
ncbi:cation diffusion facilitator family transporter, partial [Candida albicans P60002]